MTDVMTSVAAVRIEAPAGHSIPDGLTDAFWRYERALMANDLNELDALFAPGADTLRGDVSGLLVGHDTITAFRNGRGGAPQRTVIAVHLRPIDANNALIVAIVSPHSGGRGQQTQLWRRTGNGWVVTAAQVSAPAPAIDRTIWRLVGSPLVAGKTAAADAAADTDTASAGATAVGQPRPLTGFTVAVKDLFQIAGFTVGAGVPAYLAESSVSAETAPAVAALLAGGADVTGIARTDEFAYSIAGRNQHYGTPPNPAVVGGLPGGSSSGPASAVSLGQATIALATDTAGSIRVPASYQGLWGLRTTHGAVSTAGVLPLAPSFDTVGWLTRASAPLAAVAATTLDGGAQLNLPAEFVALDTAAYGLETDVDGAFIHTVDAARRAGVSIAAEAVWLGDPDGLCQAFRALQGFEAWATHGRWVRDHPGALGADIAARFDAAAAISPDEAEAARASVTEAAEQISATLAGHILLLPSASSAAPSARADPATIERVRFGTLRLTCLAGIMRAPALSVPLMRVAAGPVGLCLVGPRFGDRALISRGQQLADALGMSAQSKQPVQ